MRGSFSPAPRSRLRPIPTHTAIVRRDTGDVLGVINSAYGIVTHADAVELGRRCCRELFGVADGERIDVIGVDAPAAGTQCHVDLAPEGRVINVAASGQAPDLWTPFVRVTNSYARSRALRFDVGFRRKATATAVVLEGEHVRYTRAAGSLQPSIRFAVSDGQARRLVARFKELIGQARAAALNEQDSRAILRSVFGIRDEKVVSEQRDARRRLEWLAILNGAHDCLRRQRIAQGANAYAVLAALSELARTLGSMPGSQRDTDAMQKLAGEWLATSCGGEPAVAQRAA